MFKLISPLTLLILLYSCQRNTKQSDSLPDVQAEEMVISYDDSTRLTQGAIDTLITNPQEIKQMKRWIKNSVKSHTSCEKWTGAVSFRNSKDSVADLGISNECPSAFYRYVEREAHVYIMPKECETYLKNIMKNSLH